MALPSGLRLEAAKRFNLKARAAGRAAGAAPQPTRRGETVRRARETPRGGPSGGVGFVDAFDTVAGTRLGKYVRYTKRAVS